MPKQQSDTELLITQWTGKFLVFIITKMSLLFWRKYLFFLFSVYSTSANLRLHLHISLLRRLNVFKFAHLKENVLLQCAQIFLIFRRTKNWKCHSLNCKIYNLNTWHMILTKVTMFLKYYSFLKYETLFLANLIWSMKL